MHTLEYDGLVFKMDTIDHGYTTVIKGFKVYDQNGNMYYFGAYDSNEPYDHMPVEKIDSYTSSFTPEQPSFQSYTNAWHLNKIKNSSNSTIIEFRYNDGYVQETNEFHSKYKICLNAPGGIGNCLFPSDKPSYHTSQMIVYNTKKIDSIFWNNNLGERIGSIDFKYELGRDDMKDSEGAVLEEIIVKSELTGKKIKKVSLESDYVITDNSHLNGFKDFDNNDYLIKRLFLDSVVF